MASWNVSYRHVRINASVRTRKIAFPRRERLLVRQALENLHHRYMEIVPIFNPHYTGNRGQYPNGIIQWFDFFFMMSNGHMGCLLFSIKYPTHGGAKPYEIRAFEAKKLYMQERKVPVLVLSRTYSRMEYEFLIQHFDKRHSHDLQTITSRY